MEEKRNVPKLRFSGFTDDWEQRKVSEITDFHKQGFYTTEPYDESKKYYLLRGTDLTENRLVLKDTPKINATEKDYQAFKIQVGDFLIVRSGTVGTYGIVYEELPAIFGSYLIDFRFDKSQVTNEFFGYFYQSDLFKNQLKQIVQQSVNININAENIKSTSIKLPSIPEQESIGRFFANLDNIIILHQRKLDCMKEYKKGLLQKMFPKKGETVPEIRFPGFTDDWEQRKLLDLLTQPISDGPHETPVLVDEGIPFISVDAIVNNKIEFDRKRGYITEEYDLECRKKYSPQRDDVYMVKSGSTVGKVAIVETDERFNIWSPLAAMRANKEVLLPKYLYYFLQLDDIQDEVSAKSKGGTQPNLSMRILEKFLVRLPDVEEQKKISDSLNCFDNLITLHQCKLDAMKKYKKGLLQQMFV